MKDATTVGLIKMLIRALQNPNTPSENIFMIEKELEKRLG